MAENNTTNAKELVDDATELLATQIVMQREMQRIQADTLQLQRDLAAAAAELVQFSTAVARAKRAGESDLLAPPNYGDAERRF